MNDIVLTIGWFYPELMSTYGDRGNITCLLQRMQWRGFQANIVSLDREASLREIKKIDIFVGGGAQDRQQEIVMRDLRGEKSKLISDMIENHTPGIFTCGSPQLLGRYYEPAFGKRIEGLGIFDMVSVHPGIGVPRCIGNIVVKTGDFFNKYKDFKNYNNYLVGFENHGGRTYLGKNVKPLGRVVMGFGNNGEDKTEGAIYKNAFATYLHGPILPKNPFFADLLLSLALEKKYHKKIQLEQLDDELEQKAHDFMVKRTLAA
jgi:CobQ-like glutamine amidotransferase family enzyme